MGGRRACGAGHGWYSSSKLVIRLSYEYSFSRWTKRGVRVCWFWLQSMDRVMWSGVRGKWAQSANTPLKSIILVIRILSELFDIACLYTCGVESRPSVTVRGGSPDVWASRHSFSSLLLISNKRLNSVGKITRQASLALHLVQETNRTRKPKHRYNHHAGL